MKLREQKRILEFLKMLEHLKENKEEPALSTDLLKHYTDDELRDVLKWLYSDTWSTEALAQMKRLRLIELLNSDYGLLLWTIHNIEQRMTSSPRYTQSEIDAFFKAKQKEMHYLASKPVHVWDEYDKSNYRHLLITTGTTKRVFGIFMSDVKDKDVYLVQTEAKHLFDTKEEAQTELNELVTNGDFSKGELVIQSLWLLP